MKNLITKNAFIEGFDLLDLGAFPGIVPGKGRVWGEIHRVDDQMLASLDRIEGFYQRKPEASLYLREEVQVIDPIEERTYHPVFTYVYNCRKNKDRKLKIIESGDWLGYKNLVSQVAERNL